MDQSQNDGVSAPEAIGVMADHQRTYDGADVVEDRQIGDDSVGKSVHRLKKIRIEVLGAVGQTSDGGHHQHQVDKILLVMPKDPDNFSKTGQAMLLP